MDDPALFRRGREAGLPSNLPIDGHSFRRVEVLTGAPRRRRWSAAEKAAIVAESLAPGAIASTIALRHGLHRNQLYMWRRELRSGALANAGVGFCHVADGRVQRGQRFEFASGTNDGGPPTGHRFGSEGPQG